MSRGASRYPEDCNSDEYDEDQEEEFSQSVGTILGMRNPMNPLLARIAPHGQM